MIPRRSLSPELLHLAARQDSTVSGAQLAGFGVTDRVIERNRCDAWYEEFGLLIELECPRCRGGRA